MIYSSIIPRTILIDSSLIKLNRRYSSILFKYNRNRYITYFPRSYLVLTQNQWSNILNTNQNYYKRFFSTEKPPPGFGKFNKKNEPSESNCPKQPEEEEKTPFTLSDWKKTYQKFRKDEDPKDDSKGKLPRILDPSVFLIFGLITIIILEFVDTNGLRNEITFQEFLSRYFIKAYVDRIQVVNKDFCRCYISEHSPIKTPKYVTFRIGSIDSFEQKVDDIQTSMGLHPQNFIPIHYVNEINFLSEFKKLSPFLFVMLLIGLGLRKINVKTSSSMDRFLKMGKATPVEGKEVKVNVKFKDVAGMNEAKIEITEFVDFLRSPKTYESYGAKIPKGVLLVGAPGTGKTLLAKAVAGEANVPFYSMSGSDFIEVFVGIGPSRVRDLFEKARKNAPSIIFIDEIDAIGRKRSKSGFMAGSNDERENTLNQLLVEMDGFKTTTGVIVLAGTNRADILDPALTRPGRFDRTVNISKPDLDERYEIFKVHLKPLKFNTSINVDEFARKLATLTPNFVGAEIANVCNEAAIQAARRKSKEGVDMIDFDNAIERVIAGMKKPPGLLTPQQKLAVAYHEVGHALIGWWLEHADPVLKVSIIPRSSGALGFAQQMPDDSMLFTRDALLDKIAVILGGRAAEDIFIGKITTGATDDLNKVTKMCYAFVSQWGMNAELGLVSFQRDTGEDPNFYRNYSETTAQLIDKEVRIIIENQYQRVKNMLSKKADLVHKLSKLLYDKETITYHDIANCVGEREFPMKEKYRPYIESKEKKLNENELILDKKN